MTPGILSTEATVFLAAISVGGALYEHAVVDAAWPRNPVIIQPAKLGLSRVRFWVPAHVALEVSLIAALAMNWKFPGARNPLLAAFTCHAVMRIWTFIDLIPKVLAFERADAASISRASAKAWVVRSMLRLPLSIGTMALAFAASLTNSG
jgi:hypothetical protein